MTYKGTGWTRGDLGNVPDRNPTMKCSTDGCDATIDAQELPGNWQASSDPDIPLLCPSCKQQQERLERRRERNQELTEWTDDAQ